ncbi:MAG: MbnP family copper-binding protein [Waterburya sp.]
MLLKFNQKTVLLASAIACGVCGVTQAQPSTQEIAINFAAYVGEAEFACGESYKEVGTTKSTITPKDFRFYVSNLALIDEAGNAIPLKLAQDGKWQYQNTALLDFEDGTKGCDNGTAEINTTVKGTIPAGDYQSLQFTLGVPQKLNHSDAAIAPSPLNLTSMWWNWQGGYKFLRVDLETAEAIANVGNSHTNNSHNNSTSGQVNHSQSHSTQTGNSQISHQDTHSESTTSGHGGETTSSNAYLIHLGSTGCSASAQSNLFSCASPNRVQVMLEDFNAKDDVVIADLGELLAQSDLSTNQANTPNGCMSSPEDGDCMPIMQNLNLFSSTDSTGDAAQYFFFVE